MYQDTAEVLAVRFPHVPKRWLYRLNAKLGKLKAENGGNVDMSARFEAGKVRWTDWTQRDLEPRTDS